MGSAITNPKPEKRRRGGGDGANSTNVRTKKGMVLVRALESYHIDYTPPIRAWRAQAEGAHRGRAANWSPTRGRHSCVVTRTPMWGVPRGKHVTISQQTLSLSHLGSGPNGSTEQRPELVLNLTTTPQLDAQEHQQDVEEREERWTGQPSAGRPVATPCRCPLPYVHDDDRQHT
jgi:hypothetical protein